MVAKHLAFFKSFKRSDNRLWMNSIQWRFALEASLSAKKDFNNTVQLAKACLYGCLVSLFGAMQNKIYC